MIATLVMCCILSAPESPPTATPEPENWLELQPVGEDLVPPAPTFKPGLPGLERRPGGMFLPTPLDIAVSDMMVYCTERYPLVVAEAISAAREAEARQWMARMRVERAQWLHGQVGTEIDASRWSTFEVILVAGAVGLAAAGAGVVVGVVMQK